MDFDFSSYRESTVLNFKETGGNKKIYLLIAWFRNVFQSNLIPNW